MRVPPDVLLDNETVAAALERACVRGFNSMSLRTATAAASAWLYPELTEENRRKAQRILHDLACDLVDLIVKTSTKDLRPSLKSVLADLEYLADGFKAGRRPRRDRLVGGDALAVLTGRLPKSLVPMAGGIEFTDFGRLQIGRADRKNASLIPVDRNSFLLPGILDLVSGTDKAAAVFSRSLSKWPRCLSALDLQPAILPERAIRVERILDLSLAERRELSKLATIAKKWLLRCFGIRNSRDPLHFDRSRLAVPRASATILASLTEIICPWPQVQPAKEILEKLREPRFSELGVHKDMQGSAYAIIFDIVCRFARQQTGYRSAALEKRIDAIGMLVPDSDTFDRFIENYVRTFVHLRMINEARTFIQGAFVRQRRDMADRDARADGFSPADYHELGRWSDVLKGRLKLGLVDRTHGTAVRFAHDQKLKWQFPSKLPQAPTPRDVARLIVEAARQRH